MNELELYLKETGNLLEVYRKTHPVFPLYPDELQEGAFAYFLRGGKRLRPALARLSAGALGGEKAENAVIPLALGLELYHNWTLIHDDVIDHDLTRRGQKSVHVFAGEKFSSYKKGMEYGEDVAILAGDALHSAALFYIASLADGGVVSAETALGVIRELEGDFGLRLISGETLDTKNGLLFADCFHKVTDEDVLKVIAGKTAALFGISALAGAFAGQNSPRRTPEALALLEFAENCGMAFQLQDDILGLSADEKKLGKPLYSDLREGKATLILLAAYRNAGEKDREFLRGVIGKTEDTALLSRAKEILFAAGGVEYAEKTAEDYLKKAETALCRLPESRERALLQALCFFMLRRDR